MLFKLYQFIIETENMVFQYITSLVIIFIFYYQYMLVIRRNVVSATSLTCKNHMNENVDWFIIYKLPHLAHSIDPFVANGTGYIYLDSSSSLDKWRFSTQSIDTPLSLTGLTLGPLYQNKEYSYVFYNDQPPNMPVSLVYGHSKGVLAFEDTTQTGFWLVHSVPHFPQVIEKGYHYPDTGILSLINYSKTI